MSNFQQNSSQNTQANSQLNFGLDANRGNFWSASQEPRADGQANVHPSNDPSHLVSFTASHQSQLGSATVPEHYEQSRQQMDKISQIGAQINQQQRSHVSQNAASHGNTQPWNSHAPMASSHYSGGQPSSTNMGQSQQPQGPQSQQNCPVPLSLQPSGQQLIGGQTSETHLSHLKESFIQTANTFTAFYKQSQNAFNLAYQQGKQDAYEEVFMWFLSQGQNNSFKHVQANQFTSFIRERMDSQSHEKIIANYADQMHKQQTAAKSQHEDEESLRNLMPPPDAANMKNNNNFQTQNQQNQVDGRINQSLNSHDLIVMTADQCIKEQMVADQNLIGSQQINKKVNTNMMQGLKFVDNKKRGRAPQIQQQCPQSMGANSHYMGNSGSIKSPEDQNQNDNDQIMHGNFTPMGDLMHNSTNGNSENARQFMRIKRRNQIQNANAHPNQQQPSPPNSVSEPILTASSSVLMQQQQQMASDSGQQQIYSTTNMQQQQNEN